MPLYDYKCETCGHIFEKNLKMVDRNKPTIEPCPKCGEVAVKPYMGNTAPSLADPIRLGRQKPPSGFNEVLRNIQKISPGNTIKVRD